MDMASGRHCCLLVLGIFFVPVFAIFVAVIVDEKFSENSVANPFLNSKMSEIEAIAKNTVKSATTGDAVTMESLWQNQTVVITFFRRFGCSFCRLAARDMSSIKKELDENNVRLVGIGVEDLGKEDFLKGEFFSGDLYIDEDKKCFKDLQYKRFSRLGMIPAMLAKASRAAYSELMTKSMGGDMKGDIYQVGGTLVIHAGGDKVLLSHRQESLADHVDPNKILESLGLPPRATAGAGAKNGEPPVECSLKESAECQS